MKDGHKNRLKDKDQIVVIGLDACDPDLFQRWSMEGKLPFLTSLMESGVWTRLISTRSLFSDSPWPSFNAGVSPAKHAFYNYLQIKRGTTEVKRVNAYHCRYLPFWSLLEDSGKKIVAFDVPKTFPIEGIDGIQISAWGEHYPLLKQPTSQPPTLVREIIDRFGKYPHTREIITPESFRQEQRIYKTLSSNLEKKLQATEYLMDRVDWDFFMSVLSEVHYAGHQFYHCFDKEHWAHNLNAPDDVHNAMRNLYAQLDSAVARLFRHMSDQTTFFIVSVHGIVTNYSANHLMPQVMEKLGYTVSTAHGRQTNSIGALLHRTRFLRKLIPQRFRDFINTYFMPEAIHDKALSTAFRSSIDWEKTKALFLESDHFQAFISLNLKGREPFGIVEPGSEFDELCDEVCYELKRLVNPETGKPAVHEVVQISEVYQGPNLYELPDLVVQWSENAPINKLYHPRFGVISREGFELRRAQHAPEGFMIAGGEHINKKAVLNGVTTMDIAPTILYLMGEVIPDEMDGRVLFELVHEDFKRNSKPIYGSRPAMIPKAMRM